MKKPKNVSDRTDCRETVTDFDIYCSRDASKPVKEDVHICQKRSKRLRRIRHRNRNVKKATGCAQTQKNNEKRPALLDKILNVKKSAHALMKEPRPQQRPCIGSMLSSTKKRREWRSSRAKNHVENSKHIKFKTHILTSRSVCKFSDGIKARKPTFARDHIEKSYNDPVGRIVSITKEVKAYALKRNRKKGRIKPKVETLLRDESDSNVSPTQYFTKTDLFKYLAKDGRFRSKPTKPKHCQHHGSRPAVLNQKGALHKWARVCREKKSREPPDKLRLKMCFFMTKYMTSRKSRHNKKKRFDSTAADCKAKNGMNEGGDLDGSPQAFDVNSDDMHGHNWDAGTLFHERLVGSSTDILRAILQGSVDEIDVHVASTLASTRLNVHVTINVNRVDVQQAERLTVQNSHVHVTNAGFCVID
ncbi:unnamed protein product [Lymnaea stagnalis]|uniref:Uncharacterized protein n=1 Tax=Lymnaea stagnalis TaxID=6523 RepID=A0AAV2HSD0_LYMST